MKVDVVKLMAPTLVTPTQSVKCKNGDVINLAWDFDVADEAVITHFSLRGSTDPEGTYVELGTFDKTLRTSPLTVQFVEGTKFLYLGLEAVDATNPADPVESEMSNIVALERVGKPPLNFRVV